MALLDRTDRNHVAHLVMNAPQTLNALSDAMLAALQETLDDIAASDEIRAVTLAGTGKAFCAGHDLKEMQAARRSQDAGGAYFADLFTRCTTLMQTIQAMPQPVIAQVHGVAAAAGCQLVATCDMAVAAEGTRFGVNGVNIGLFCSTPMVALTRNVPRKRAFEMLTTGRLIETEEAIEIGLLNHAVPADDLETATTELAETVAGKLASAVSVGKRAFYEQAHLTTEAAYAHTGDVMVRNMLDRDTDEGITAFIEKRKPDWAG